MALRKVCTPFSWCAWLLTLALTALTPTVPAAKADQLWAGADTYWGKIISINNEFVEFQINCSGEPRKFKWAKDGFSVTFAEGCGEVDLASWGEPMNCRGRGRIFQMGNEGRAAVLDFLSYQNDVLIAGFRGKKLKNWSRARTKSEFGWHAAERRGSIFDVLDPTERPRPRVWIGAQSRRA